ncbi:hypothetical protein MMC20_004770 [Loxospora ochrophaea]|nr:hypothetical protein [Loxospora ochrophaea]
MPPIRSARNRKPPPEGFDDIEDTLLEFSNKMKDAENASHEGKKRQEVLWPIFQISHQLSQGRDISTISTMRKKLSQNSSTTISSRMGMPTETLSPNGKNKVMRR